MSNITNEWQKIKLGDISEVITNKINVSKLEKSNYISTENMLPNKGGIYEATNLPNILLTPSFQINDILVSNIRPYFKKIWYAKFSGGCSNDVLIFRAKQNTDPKFLYYVLSDDRFFRYAMSTSKGTKMPRGDKIAIMKYQVPKFDMVVQKKIAAVLSALDDKIELNNKINQNLEQQAQAIFKSWFVDFEPFGGKMPSDWRKGTFSDIVTDIISGDWGKEEPQGNYTEKVYCIKGADIPDIRTGNDGKMPIRYILPQNYASKKLMIGNLVVEVSGGSPTQSTGRISIISDHLLNRYSNKMICTNFCRALKTREIYSVYAYYNWQYLYNKNIFFSYENGTTSIKNLDISNFIIMEPIIIPSKDVATKFAKQCNTYFEQTYSNSTENLRLAQLRDALLPKLMSGEIDVSRVNICDN